MRELSAGLHRARMLLTQAQGWFLFVEIPTVAGGYFRLVDNNRHIQAGGKKWQATSIGIEWPEESIDDPVGDLRLTISNVSRLPLAYVESGEILGKNVVCYYQHESQFGGAMPAALSWQHIAAKATANADVLTIECGHPARYRKMLRRFTRQKFRQLLAQGGIAR